MRLALCCSLRGPPHTASARTWSLTGPVDLAGARFLDRAWGRGVKPPCPFPHLLKLSFSYLSPRVSIYVPQTPAGPATIVLTRCCFRDATAARMHREGQRWAGDRGMGGVLSRSGM